MKTMNALKTTGLWGENFQMGDPNNPSKKEAILQLIAHRSKHNSMQCNDRQHGCCSCYFHLVATFKPTWFLLASLAFGTRFFRWPPLFPRQGVWGGFCGSRCSRLNLSFSKLQRRSTFSEEIFGRGNFQLELTLLLTSTALGFWEKRACSSSLWIHKWEAMRMIF